MDTLFFAKSITTSYFLLGRGWRVRGARLTPDGRTLYAFDPEAQRDLYEYNQARLSLYAKEQEQREEERS